MKILEWIEVLHIVAKYSPKYFEEDHIFEADHDIIYTHLDTDMVPEDSEDGKRLLALGLSIHSYNIWATYT